MSAVKVAESEINKLHAAGFDTARNPRCWIWEGQHPPGTYFLKLDMGVDQAPVARRFGYVPAIEFHFATFKDVPCESL